MEETYLILYGHFLANLCTLVLELNHDSTRSKEEKKQKQKAHF